MDQRYDVIKAAHYYYDMGYTQQEIAEKMHTSRQRVNRLLKSALEEGIVKIYVNGYKDSPIELESRLEQQLGLQQALISPQGGTVFSGMVTDYLGRVVEDGCTVGVTFGDTLSKVATVNASFPRKDVSVVQLLGGINTNSVELKPDEIASRFASCFNGKSYSLFIPAIVENIMLKELISREQQLSYMFDYFGRIDVAVLAVGAMWNDTMLTREGYLKRRDFDRLKELGAVGDVCFRFIDIGGRIVDDELNSRVTGISTEDLKKVPLRIGVAYGRHKVRPIIAAVRGCYINVLITDAQTARLLLDYDNSGNNAAIQEE